MRHKVPAHIIRFFHPDSIDVVHHMVSDPDSGRVAVLKRTNCEDRSDRLNVIEVWSVTGCRNPVVIKRLFVSSLEHSLLENVAWGPNGRLFSCGHNSSLYEHDLALNVMLKSVTVGGGIVWCMACDAHKSKLALGSENGTITVFDVGLSAESISFGQVVGKCRNRVLSIVWSASDSEQTQIIAGSIDHITIWNYRKCVCIAKLDVKQGCIPDGETFIWSLAVSGERLVSGDSKGFTSFWDLKNKVGIQSIHSHESDVLVVAADSDGRVYSAGVDPKVSCFVLNENGVDLVHEHRNHRHDVKAIVIGPQKHLLSAGNGPFIVQIKPGSKKSRLSFLDFRSKIHIFQNSVLLNYHKSLELYDLSADAEPVKALTVRSKTPILSSTCDESHVAYRTASVLCLLNRSSDRRSVQKVNHEFQQSPLSIDHLILINNQLIVVCNNELVGLELSSGQVANRLKLPGCTYHCFSLDKEIVLIQADGTISVVDTDSWSCSEMEPVTDMIVDHAVDPKDKRSFWLLTARKKIMSYSLSAPLVFTENDIGDMSRHIQFMGMTACRNTLLVYTSDFILSLGTEKYNLRHTTSGAFKHVVKLASDGSVLFVVELLAKELDMLLPSMFDGKSTQPFLK